MSRSSGGCRRNDNLPSPLSPVRSPALRVQIRNPPHDTVDDLYPPTATDGNHSATPLSTTTSSSSSAPPANDCSVSTNASESSLDFPNAADRRESLRGKTGTKDESAHTATTYSMLDSSHPSLGFIDDSGDEDDDVNAVFNNVAAAHTATSPKETAQHKEIKDAHPRVTISLRRRVRRFRNWIGELVNNDRVQLFSVFLIVMNAIIMGIGTFDFVMENPNVDKAWEQMDQVFLILFTVELSMQFIYHGPNLFADVWLVFDFLVVVFSWSLESLQIVRAFRIFRAFRLVTRLTVLKNLIVALIAVGPSMVAIVSLLLLILYIYAVMCTVLFKDLYEQGVTNEDYFGRLDTTLFTLFQMMTLEWADIVRQVMEKYYWAWAVFSTFLVCTSFILYSLIIAVVCNAVSDTEHHDKVVNALEEKKETHLRVRELHEKIHKMSVHQSAVLGAVQRALEELAIGEDEGALPTEDSLRQLEYIASSSKVNGDTAQSARVGNISVRFSMDQTKYVGTMQHSTNDANNEPVLVFEPEDSDTEAKHDNQSG